MGWPIVCIAMIFPILLLIVPRSKLLRLDVQSARIPDRERAVKIMKW